METHEALLMANDLSAFADVGTDAPKIDVLGKVSRITFVRAALVTQVLLSANGIEEVVGDRVTKYSSFKALLASDGYGGLRDWAAKQTAFLTQLFAGEPPPIEVYGYINGDASAASLQQVDLRLIEPLVGDAARVMLIDGPAGIGKTQFIGRLALSRAQNYAEGRRPLVLHVQSRGRTLTYLFDLIAYSLQRIRVSVTYDQVPVLVRNGLITLAIDGFDELADPDGYGLAWQQVSDLITGLRGRGSIILAGRETFIGRDRVEKEISSLRPNIDAIDVVTLQSPTKSDAMSWLAARGWSSELLESIEQFLEPSSLALRPFFLSTLADESIMANFARATSTSVLAILIESMIDRETGKFGDAVDAELDRGQRKSYVSSLMREVARDLADNASGAISDATLAWLVEVSLPTKVSDAVKRMLQHRAQVIAFLTNDDRPGFRRFFHDKFYEYFLSHELVATLQRGEISKVVSRGIVGASLLETFSDVIARGVQSSQAGAFLSAATELVNTYPPIDRVRKNVASLLIASLAVIYARDEEIALSDVEVDEARFGETSGTAHFERVIISQLDVRGADLSLTTFEGCMLVSVIADSDTIVPKSFPVPTSRIHDLSTPGALTSPNAMAAWVEEHLSPEDRPVEGVIPLEFRSHPAIKVLQKACRLRQYWLRNTAEDVFAAKILQDPSWAIVEECLDDVGLLRAEFRDASGTPSRFIHIRQADAILAEDTSSSDVTKLYSLLLASISSPQVGR